MLAAAVVAALAGVGMFAGALNVEKKAHDLADAASKISQQAKRVGSPAASVESAGLPTFAQTSTRHLDDLRIIFDIATRHGVRVANAEVDRQDSRTTGFAVRGVNLRLSEEYPAFKSFLSSLLAATPHGYLADLRMERSDPSAPRVDVSLRIAFIYVDPVPNASGPTGARER